MRRYQLAVSLCKVVLEANVDGRILDTGSKFWFLRQRLNLCSPLWCSGGDVSGTRRGVKPVEFKPQVLQPDKPGVVARAGGAPPGSGKVCLQLVQ